MSETKPEEAKKTDNWAEMSDEHVDEDEQIEVEVEKPKKIKPAKKGTKNRDGDYVITTLDIPDMRTGMREAKEKTGLAAEIDSDSDTEYDEEDDNKEAAVEEKVEGK